MVTMDNMNAGVADIMEVLRRVHDPELPFVSVCDLGIVRRVEKRRDDDGDGDGEFTVTITPTFSGCPAYSVIQRDIDAALRAAGFNCRVVKELSPPWRSGDVSEAGRAALRANGIAVVCGGDAGPRCPHCDSGDTETLSEFGATACKSFARCLRCAEPFEVFK